MRAFGVRQHAGPGPADGRVELGVAHRFVHDHARIADLRQLRSPMHVHIQRHLAGDVSVELLVGHHVRAKRLHKHRGPRPRGGLDRPADDPRVRDDLHIRRPVVAGEDIGCLVRQGDQGGACVDKQLQPLMVRALVGQVRVVQVVDREHERHRQRGAQLRDLRGRAVLEPEMDVHRVHVASVAPPLRLQRRVRPPVAVDVRVREKLHARGANGLRVRVLRGNGENLHSPNINVFA